MSKPAPWMLMRAPLAIVLALGIFAACSSDPPEAPKLGAGPLRAVLNPDGTRASIGSNTQAGAPWSYGMNALCTTGKAQRITDVTVYRPAGGKLRVVDWGIVHVTPQAPARGIASEPTTVAGLGGYSHDPVTAKCARFPPTTFDMFAVSFTTTSKRAQIDGVVLHYANGQRTLDPFGVAMCVDHSCEAPAI